MRNLYFVSGLPRSGTTLLCNILKQNPEIHSESVSTLCSLFGTINGNWIRFDTSQEYPNLEAKKNCLKAILNHYHDYSKASTVFDKDRGWLAHINLLETVLEKPVKMIVCVRNPAEILTSFERLRRENPLFFTRVDNELREESSITSRAFYFASSGGPLGLAMNLIQDAVMSGYLDRLLFVDYGRFCSTPKSQLKRIYDFFELPSFEHDLNNIVQTEDYNYFATGYPNLHEVRSSIDKTTTNCVQYLGLDLYEQFNSKVFWNAWI